LRGSPAPTGHGADHAPRGEIAQVASFRKTNYCLSAYLNRLRSEAF
jgi:hypothetical protein